MSTTDKPARASRKASAKPGPEAQAAPEEGSPAMSAKAPASAAAKSKPKGALKRSSRISPSKSAVASRRAGPASKRRTREALDSKPAEDQAPAGMAEASARFVPKDPVAEGSEVSEIGSPRIEVDAPEVEMLTDAEAAAEAPETVAAEMEPPEISAPNAAALEPSLDIAAKSETAREAGAIEAEDVASSAGDAAPDETKTLHPAKPIEAKALEDEPPVARAARQMVDTASDIAVFAGANLVTMSLPEPASKTPALEAAATTVGAAGEIAQALMEESAAFTRAQLDRNVANLGKLPAVRNIADLVLVQDGILRGSAQAWSDHAFRMTRICLSGAAGRRQE